MGGKSRKSGGVSKKLIAHIKSGDLKSSSCGKKKNPYTDEQGNIIKTIFDESEGTERDT